MSSTSSSKYRNDLVKTIMESVRRMRREVVTCNKRKMMITPAQWGILGSVLHDKVRTVKELARHFRLSSSAVTQHVNGLVDKGFLLRREDSADRRKIILTPTASFQKKARAFHANLTSRLAKLFEVLDDKELQEFARLHQKIVRHFPSHDSHGDHC